MDNTIPAPPPPPTNRVIASNPTHFRYLQQADGTQTLQEGYEWETASESGIEWRDVPVVQD